MENLLPDEKDVRFYKENGYWIGPKFLSDEELEAVRDRHARIVAGVYETGRSPWWREPAAGEPLKRVVKVDNSYWTDSVLAKLTLHPIIGAMAARLSESKCIRLWHDELLLKPPGIGAVGNIGWHQDYQYWQCTDPPSLLTAWIALDDVDEENGCMQVVPESHKCGLLSDGNFHEHDLERLKHRFEERMGMPFVTHKCIMLAGSVSFHHCLTIHGSGINRSEHSRRSHVIHLQPEGVRYKPGTPSDTHMNVTLNGGLDGSPFIGPYFPVLYREGERANPWLCCENR